MKTRLLILLMAIVATATGINAQNGIGLLHRHTFEWGRVGPITFMVITSNTPSDTSRHLRLEWGTASPITYHRVTLTCAEAQQVEAALEQMKTIQATTPELGHEYIYQVPGNSGLALILYASANFGGGASWRLSIDNTADLITNSATDVAALTNLTSIANYFRDFNLKCL